MPGSASLLLLPLLATELWAAPLTKYDQRQDGEFNVHAHLENFVILLIPGGGGGLLNIAAKVAPGKHHGGKHVKGTVEGSARHPVEEASVAIPVGLKSPPYKVDIDADRRAPIVLQITAPRLGEEQHEVVIAESPAVSLTKVQSPVPKEAEKPEDSIRQPEEPARAEDKPSKVEDNPPKAEEKPSELSEKPQGNPDPTPVTLPAKSEPARAPAPAPAPAPIASPVQKPIRKPAAAPAAAAAAPVVAPAAADQKEAAVATGAERPAEPAKPAAAAVPAPAPAVAAVAPAGEQPPPPPKQVAQEAKSRASRLELLRTGLVPSPAGPCAPHEVRDGRCARALEPARVTKNFEDAMLLKALRFGLAPAN